MKTILGLLFGMMAFHGWCQFGAFPVTLSLPYDKDTITTKEPVLVWQCNLAAIQSDPRLSLQLGLTELQAGQTAAEAIALNPAIVVANNLQSTSYAYPSTMQELEAGHTYVWQVRLLYNDQPVQESEPWQFTLAAVQVPRHEYILLRRQPDGSRHVLGQPVLYIMIPKDREVTSHQAVVRNAKNESFRIDMMAVPLASGEVNEKEENLYYVADMRDKNPPKGSYTLEWRSGKGQVYYLKFNIE